jgi:hypothetical protein
MKRQKERKSKRGVRGEKKVAEQSTSFARANFANALKTARKDDAIIAFDRYGKRVAALVSMNAVLMLAGRGGEVPAPIREKIQRMAGTLTHGASARRSAEVRRPVAKRGSKKIAGRKSKAGKKTSAEKNMG